MNSHKWSNEEMALLNKLVTSYPMWHVPWTEVASYFPGRSKK